MHLMGVIKLKNVPHTHPHHLIIVCNRPPPFIPSTATPIANTMYSHHCCCCHPAVNVIIVIELPRKKNVLHTHTLII
jgi:hypothetical protein